MKNTTFLWLIAISAILIFAAASPVSVFAQDSQTFGWDQLYNSGFAYSGVGSFHQGNADGSFYADQNTANKVCQLRGFSGASSFITDNYTSCGDNYYFKWSGSSWTQFNACQSNLQLQTVTCSSVNTPSGSDCANGIELTGPEYFAAHNAGKISITFTRQGGTEVAHIINNTNCRLPVSASSYKVFDPLPVLSTQQLYDKTAVVNVGANTSANLSVNVANCKTQVDVWYKDAPNQIFTNINYGIPTALPYVLEAIVTPENYCSVGNIVCNTNSDCGTNGFVGAPFCQGNNVYQNYITYICNAAGTLSSYCTNSTSAQLKTTCAANQTCSNGACIDQSGLPVIDFRANGSTGSISIAYNTGVTLTWTTTGATSCMASGDWSGSKATSGSEFVGYLTQNKTYILTCTGPGGTTVSNVIVNVNGQSQVPTIDFRANGSTGSISIAYNTGVTLTWTTTGATSCTASGDWSGSKATSGSEFVGYLTQNKTYILTCTGTGGTTIATVSANITGQSQAPTVDLRINGYADSITLPSNSTATLTWNSTNATSCVASGNWYGTKATSGSETTGVINSSVSYTLVCTNSYGSTTDSVSVTISQQPYPPCYFGQCQNNNLTLLKQGRNLSKGVNVFSDVIVADPNDIVMFQITVRNPGSNILQSVMVRDILPSRVIFNGGLLVDGNPVVGGDGGLFGQGMNIGNLAYGQTKVINYQVRVADIAQFSTGQTRLMNEASATSYNGGVANDSAAICITRNLISGVSYGNIPSYISTGITDNPFVDFVVIPLGLTLFIFYIFKSKILLLNQRIKSKLSGNNLETEDILSVKIKEIRKNEFGLD